MSKSQGGGRQRQSARSKELAAYLKAHRVCRTTGRCGSCYQIIQIESWQSRYRHACHG